MIHEFEQKTGIAVRVSYYDTNEELLAKFKVNRGKGYDLIFPSDCIENAMITMKKHFPDGYGVVTLGRKHKAIFGLIGDKWVRHFPNRQMLCPYYTHYGSDPEHTAFARKIGKFAYPPKRDSQVKHYRINDKTRILSRKSRTRDLRLLNRRKEKGRIWGIDFERL